MRMAALIPLVTLLLPQMVLGHGPLEMAAKLKGNVEFNRAVKWMAKQDTFKILQSFAVGKTSEEIALSEMSAWIKKKRSKVPYPPVYWAAYMGWDTKTPIKDYIPRVDLNALQVVLKAGADPNAFVRWIHNNPMYFAAYQTAEPTFEVLKLLVDAGANVNPVEGPHTDEIAPLYLAMHYFRPHDKAVEYLLTHGAKANLPNNRGSFVNEVSIGRCSDQNVRMVKMLLNHGGDPRLGNSDPSEGTGNLLSSGVNSICPPYLEWALAAKMSLEKHGQKYAASLVCTRIETDREQDTLETRVLKTFKILKQHGGQFAPSGSKSRLEMDLESCRALVKSRQWHDVVDVLSDWPGPSASKH